MKTPSRIDLSSSFEEIGFGAALFRNACTDPARAILIKEVVCLLTRLHRRFDARRRELIDARASRVETWDRGRVPDYEDRTSEAVCGDWKVAPVPADLRTRRVEITGPVSSAKMVINMLSRNGGHRADTAMLDFEDSMKPSWDNVIQGVKNVIGAANGTLRLETPEKTYGLDPADMPVVMVRCRGLHLTESNFIVDGQPICAGLFDLVLCVYHTAKVLLAQGKTPTYYVPKTEHHLEARWWAELFAAVEEAIGLPHGTLRVTFLIETLPAAYQIEEILYELRDYAAGLNVGRWDKIFSDIKVLKNHPDRIMADRARITMQKPWMDHYARRLIKICHERGAHAIGGMSAFTPGKTPELREKQTAKVAADKANEFAMGHDGCWVSHPYFIPHALAQFKRPEQTDRLLPEFDRYPDILPRGEEPRTIEGLRTNVRVGIAYQKGWNEDIGCVSWDNLMEDLATLEISRAQTWQWLHHTIRLEEGWRVTRELVDRTFNEELATILTEVEPATHGAFRKAAEDARGTFLRPDLPDYFRTASDFAPSV
jgi:malate synthase